jgi:hypothetical protein
LYEIYFDKLAVSWGRFDIMGQGSDLLNRIGSCHISFTPPMERGAGRRCVYINQTNNRWSHARLGWIFVFFYCYYRDSKYYGLFPCRIDTIINQVSSFLYTNTRSA